MKPSAGSWPAAASAPISLSIALWRPTSSRTVWIAPAGEAKAAAWAAPVLRPSGWWSRKRGERGEDRGFGRARRGAATGGSGRATASRFSIPHSPHELSATRARTRSVSWSMPRPASAGADDPAVLDFGDGDVGQVGRRFRQAFGQREAEREILEVGGRGHHHRVAEAVELERDGGFGHPFARHGAAGAVGRISVVVSPLRLRGVGGGSSAACSRFPPRPPPEAGGGRATPRRNGRSRARC